MKDTIIKINIKSIIRFEQFTNKSFNEIDYMSEDLIKFLYCIIIENNDERFLYEDFLELTKSTKILKDIIEKFNKEFKIIEQFTNKKEANDEIIASGDTKKSIFIKDIASLLIVQGGLDINYVMNEMTLNDIGMYAYALNDKIKTEMTDKRMWSYLSMLPNLDKKTDTPQKYLPFPWDEEKQEISTEQYKMTEEEFRNIMKNHKHKI